MNLVLAFNEVNPISIFKHEKTENVQITKLSYEEWKLHDENFILIILHRIVCCYESSIKCKIIQSETKAHTTQEHNYGKFNDNFLMPQDPS
mgnify:CR=1 FL=1